MSRAQGEIYVEPCEGIKVEKEPLIILLVNVYGLDDAPLAWRKTIVGYLKTKGFTRSLLEPCWRVRYAPDGTILNMVHLEVDDLFIASNSETSRAWIRETL
eukprot:7393579-Pyramimonas_sp.AAC.1